MCLPIASCFLLHCHLFLLFIVIPTSLVYYLFLITMYSKNRGGGGDYRLFTYANVPVHIMCLHNVKLSYREGDMNFFIFFSTNLWLR